jgi:arsenate reductase-like glutaredoxin family protein
MSEKVAMNDTAQTATEIATSIESAVRKDDNPSYGNALAEVDKFRLTHSADETQKLVGAITKKLEEDKMLPRVSLFEAKRDFDRIDVSGDGNLKVRELNAFKGQRDVNDLQQKFVEQVASNFDGISKHNTEWSTESGITAQDLEAGIKSAAEREQREAALTNLFKKNESGVSLYDKLKDADGNIPPNAIGKLQELDKQNAKVLGLSDQDRASLELLNANKSVNQKVNYFADDMKKEDLKKLCQDNAIDFDKLVPAESERNKAALQNLFQKNANGQSLYERLKDNDGNIPAETVKKLSELDQQLPAASGLSDKDRATLKALGTEDVSKDLLNQKCKDSGLDLSTLMAEPAQVEKKSPEQ